MSVILKTNVRKSISHCDFKVAPLQLVVYLIILNIIYLQILHLTYLRKFTLVASVVFGGFFKILYQSHHHKDEDEGRGVVGGCDWISNVQEGGVCNFINLLLDKMKRVR